MVSFSSEVYQKFPFDMLGMTMANFDGELTILLFSDNNCIVSIMP